MEIATWNVNSLRVRLPQVLDYLCERKTDILALQEIKSEEAQFPFAQFREIGYTATVFGQKTYNGVALLIRDETVPPLRDVVRGMGDFADPAARLLRATADTPAGALRIINAYFVNGQSPDSDKYAYKMRWLDALQNILAEELTRLNIFSQPPNNIPKHDRSELNLTAAGGISRTAVPDEIHPPTAPKSHLILLGDFNIAPEERDSYDAIGLAETICHTAAERRAFRELLAAGMTDAFRLFEQPEKSFTWWDYRSGAFRRGHGLRIDHILVSHAGAAHVGNCRIDTEPRTWNRPSDHAPVVLEWT